MLPENVESPTNNNNIFTINNNNNNQKLRRSTSGNNNITTSTNGRRYAEIESLKKIRGDGFLESYLQGLGPEPPPGEEPADRELLTDLSPFRLLHGSRDSVDQEECSASGSSDEGESPACDIGLVERLIRTHQVWFLPGIQRAGAFHLLQGKEEGNFVVRQSSQPDTMAMSVRLPVGKGPYIEHYLIQAHDGQLSLESSDNRFDNIPSLIAHYSQCCDELPVQLTLPRALREARNRQQLSSLALLGQEFWRYPMANPRPPERQQQQQAVGDLVALQRSGEGQQSSPSSGSSLSSFGSGNNNHLNGCVSRTPTSELGTSDAIILNLAPISPAEPHQPLTTFKGSADTLDSPCSPTTTSCQSFVSSTSLSATMTPVPAARSTRPTPPNTLNLVCAASQCSTISSSGVRSTTTSPSQVASPQSNGEVSSRSGPLVLSAGKTPPPPPPRWAKPNTGTTSGPGQNFTVTTTVTFSVNNSTPPPHVEVSCVQVTPKRPPLELESRVLSPTATSTPSLVSQIQARGKKHRPAHHNRPNVKESQHYQECDILESPTVYYRSSVADKVSDYEDIWGPEAMSTFKPRSSPFSSPEDISIGSNNTMKKTPDILERVGTPVSASCNSLVSVGQKERNRLGLVISPVQSTTPPSDETQKQGSPFYAEPADALKQIPRRRPPQPFAPRSHRHSDPAPMQQWPASPTCGLLERIDSTEELHAALSSSVDNLTQFKAARAALAARPRGKPVQPPKLKGKSFNDTSWAVDSSWEFFGNENDADQEFEDEGEERERRFPSLEQQETTLEEGELCSPRSRVTVQDLIAQRFPTLRLSPEPLSSSYGINSSCDGPSSRMSSYDNVEGRASSDNDDSATVFSEPWDSSRWESLLQQPGSQLPSTKQSFRERLDPLLSPPRLQALRNRDAAGTGASIRAYALHLAGDRSTTFAQNIENFISCTKDSRETNPQIVMRNMRQFMSGMKNYLVKHGEREFEKEVEKERVKLKANEFLNLDAILEGVMHKLVVRPLKEHLYHLFVEEYTKTGAIELLAENIRYARSKTMHELGVRAKIAPPSPAALENVLSYLTRLQQVDSPLEKLENLLASISAIFNSVKASNQGRSITLGADDFLPLFVWVLVQSGMVAAEIEAEYMWGLLHPSLLSGEGGYYLTTLSSAVHVLKNFRACSQEPGPSGNLDRTSGALLEFRSVLKIVVPDEMHGSIITKTLPVRPNMTTREVCKIIAHKARITNPQDYGLFKLIDGEETLLADGECPQDVKASVTEVGKHCMFAYKRIDAKIAWPTTSSPQ